MFISAAGQTTDPKKQGSGPSSAGSPYPCVFSYFRFPHIGQSSAAGLELGSLFASVMNHTFIFSVFIIPLVENQTHFLQQWLRFVSDFEWNQTRPV